MTFHFSSPASYAIRTKRAIPFVIGAVVGTAAASLVAYEVSQHLHNSKLVAPDYQTLEIYKKFATELNGIQINQNQIKTAINSMNKRVLNFETDLLTVFSGTEFLPASECLATVVIPQLEQGIGSG